MVELCKRIPNIYVLRTQPLKRKVDGLHGLGVQISINALKFEWCLSVIMHLLNILLHQMQHFDSPICFHSYTHFIAIFGNDSHQKLTIKVSRSVSKVLDSAPMPQIIDPLTSHLVAQTETLASNFLLVQSHDGIFESQLFSSNTYI